MVMSPLDPCLFTNRAAETLENDALVWMFGDYLAQQNSEFFKPMVQTNKMLNLKYRLLGARLKNLIETNAKGNSGHDDKAITELLIAALVLANILEHIHRCYLPSPAQIKRIQKQQNTYRQLLSHNANVMFPSRQNPVTSFNEEVKSAISSCMWPRLLVLRLKHLVLTTRPLLSSFKGYSNLIENLDQLASPLLYLFGWLFHGGRLLLNLMSLFEHVVPGAWMSEEEETLGWQVRLTAQLECNWVELVNDMIWIISITTPESLFFLVGISLVEAVITGLQSLFEIIRIQELQHGTAHTVQIHSFLDVAREDSIASQRHLEQCLFHEQKKLILRIISLASITTMTLLKTALPLFNPGIAANPIIPFVFALSTLAVTVICHLLGKWLESQKPCDEIKEEISLTKHQEPMFSIKHTFFKAQYLHLPPNPQPEPIKNDCSVKELNI